MEKTLNRRAFLAALVAAPAALALEALCAVGVPGRKLLSVPAPSIVQAYSYQSGGHVFYRIDFPDGPVLL